MKHVTVHLAQEAYLGGLVHSKWMYPFERVFNWLKKKAKNKSLSESSMVMCYLRYEIQTFGSHYFELTIPSMIAMHPRNEVQCDYRPAMILTVFHMKGSLFGCAHK